ncbi:glycosyltransferase family 9 protein [Lentisphaerota bacterium WC36G]|nr:glycosyltransferase family 9 protein [Lentisphaerae bacterium WC36]
MKKNVKRILIVKPSSLGDVVHALPALEIIKEQYPEAKIDWLVNPLFADVLEFSTQIDNIVAFNRKKLGRFCSFVSEFMSLLSELKRGKYDIVFDFQGLFRSAIFSRLASKNVIGFSEPREKISSWFYREKIEVDAKELHAIEKNCLMVCNYFNIDFHVPKVKLVDAANFSSEADNVLSEEEVSNSDQFIAIVPGARWQTKVWPPEFFAEVIKKLAQKNSKLKFICVGTFSDDENAQLIKELSAPFADNVISVTGKTTVGGMIEILRRSKGVLTNDSGPMHIAAVLNIPTFALFGPTDPAKTGPFGENTFAYLADVKCHKCLKRWCPLAENKNDGNLDCHSAINVESVVRDMSAGLTK